jgi:hypothetical protein
MDNVSIIDLNLSILRYRFFFFGIFYSIRAKRTLLFFSGSTNFYGIIKTYAN